MCKPRWPSSAVGRTRLGEPPPVLNLYGADLQGAILNDAQLQDARLNRAQLQGAGLYYAQLQRAMLSGAQLQGAYLYGAQLQHAMLDGARLEDAVLDEAQLQDALVSTATGWPREWDHARVKAAGAWFIDEVKGADADPLNEDSTSAEE
jgi:uncharacterized protein YjbI with pentapeptide repeats